MDKHILVSGDRVEFLDTRFYVAGHDKKGDPIFYPSVTEILNMYPKGPQFDEWLKQVGFNAHAIAMQAANEGSAVHGAVEALVNGEEIQWSDEVYNERQWRGMLGFMDFCERFNPEFKGAEMTVISHKYRYAGTLDLVFIMDNKRWLADVKFSNEVRETAWFQLVAYKKAWDEHNPTAQIDEVGVLHLKAKTRTKGKKDDIQGVGWKLHRPPNPVNKLFDVFLMTHGIYYYKNPNPAPKNYTLPSKVNIPKECQIKME